MSEFFAMGGYAFFIWMAYGMAALLVALEIVAVRARSKRARLLARHSEVHEDGTAHAGARLRETA